MECFSERMLLILVLELLPLFLSLSDKIDLLVFLDWPVQIDEILLLNHLSEHLLHRFMEVCFVLSLNNHCLKTARDDYNGELAF